MAQLAHLNCKEFRKSSSKLRDNEFRGTQTNRQYLNFYTTPHLMVDASLHLNIERNINLGGKRWNTCRHIMSTYTASSYGIMKTCYYSIKSTPSCNLQTVNQDYHTKDKKTVTLSSRMSYPNTKEKSSRYTGCLNNCRAVLGQHVKLHKNITVAGMSSLQTCLTSDNPLSLVFSFTIITM